MKKAFFILGLTTLSLTSQAQFSLGARGGLGLATTTDNVSPADKSLVASLGAGLIFNYKISDVFSLQPELGYAVKGERITSGGDFAQYALNYIEIPVLAKFSFGRENFKFFLNAGPDLAFLLGGTSSSKIGSRETSVSLSDAQVDLLNKIDLGLVTGVGLSFKAGPGNLFLDMRYNLGLTKLNKTSTTGVNDTFHRSLGLNVGYLYALGGE